MASRYRREMRARPAHNARQVYRIFSVAGSALRDPNGREGPVDMLFLEPGSERTPRKRRCAYYGYTRELRQPGL